MSLREPLARQALHEKQRDFRHFRAGLQFALFLPLTCR